MWNYLAWCHVLNSERLLIFKLSLIWPQKFVTFLALFKWQRLWWVWRLLIFTSFIALFYGLLFTSFKSTLFFVIWESWRTNLQRISVVNSSELLIVVSGNCWIVKRYGLLRLHVQIIQSILGLLSKVHPQVSELSHPVVDFIYGILKNFWVFFQISLVIGIGTWQSLRSLWPVIESIQLLLGTLVGI